MSTRQKSERAGTSRAATPRAGASDAPTDLELMLFFDGELDESEHARVASWVDRSDEGRIKVAGMRVVGEFVRRDAERIATAFRADDVVARVMEAAQRSEATPEKVKILDASAARIARIAARDGAGITKLRSIESASRSTKLEATKLEATKLEASKLEAANAEEATSDEPRTGVATKAKKVKPKSDLPKPANDNARLIYILAGLAAAAMIGLWVWGRGGKPSGEASPELVASMTTTAPTEKGASPPSSQGQPMAAAVEPETVTPGVEVASVDFGTQTGAVYYVPTDAKGQTTTVVWLTE